jgi:hypothetical protein
MDGHTAVRTLAQRMDGESDAYGMKWTLRRAETAFTTRSQRVAGNGKASGPEAPARDISSVRKSSCAR